MDLYDRVAEFVRRERSLRKGQPVVVAVSGGPDSLCLLDVLRRLGHRLVVAHLDHGLRPDSEEDAAFVAELAAAWGLEAVVERIPVEAQKGESLEAAARRVRYTFLSRVAQEHGLSAIATGHTADDQVETLLLHLVRGSGLTGLRGMLPRTPLHEVVPTAAAREQWLVRPLLEVWREETEAHCRSLGLTPRRDPSNEDLSLQRNRIRRELLPLLEGYNPSVRRALLRLSSVAREVAAYLEAEAEKRWDQVFRQAGEEALAVRRAAWAATPVALQRELLRLAGRRLLQGEAEWGFEAVEAARTAVLRGKPARLSLPGDLELVQAGEETILRRRDAPVLLPAYPQLASEETCFALPHGGEVALEAGWRLSVSEERDKPAGTMDRWSVVIPLARLRMRSLQVRTPRRGDRIRPRGMDGRVKLSDLFVNERVPRLARARWPVLVAEDEVLWVPGLRQAEVQDGGPWLVVRLLPPEGS